MMTMWQQLDDTLGRSFSDDAWSDHAIEQATALVQAMTPAEFQMLQSAWRLRSAVWQTRCADILPWASAPRSQIVTVLLEMVASPSDDLTIAAADTLREFDPALVAAAMTPGRAERLNDVARRNPGLSAGAIQRLLNRLQPAAQEEGQAPTRFSVAQVVKAVQEHPEHRQQMPIESALSLPVPLKRVGQEKLVFFWHPAGGPVKNRTVGAPTFTASADMHRLEDIMLQPAGPGSSGVGVAPGTPLGTPRIGGSAQSAERKQVHEELWQRTDRIMDIYPRVTASLSADEAAEADAYRRLFYRLAVIVLLPAYRALNPHFFAWLETLADTS